ncbi:hypothetical protein AB3N59_07305 [Leptospira sp. WS92.C1]
MGVEYAHVLKGLGVSFQAVGRSLTSCDAFFEKTGIKAIPGGVEDFLKNHSVSFTHAIVSSNTSYLYSHAVLCIEFGIKTLLVEKPGGINLFEIKNLNQKKNELGGKIFIAYNRRFYSSVESARQIIKEDGGVTSFTFDFTEWPHTIEPLQIPIEEKRNWILRNSSHIFDLVFHLCGNPIELNSKNFKGNLDWTPNSIFIGMGVTENKIPFSYHSNWESAGRWGIELNTKNRKLILRPLEKLQVQENRQIKIELLTVEGETFDTKYKPGLFQQVDKWIREEHENFCDLEEHYIKVKDIYSKIAGFAL